MDIHNKFGDAERSLRNLLIINLDIAITDDVLNLNQHRLLADCGAHCQKNRYHATMASSSVIRRDISEFPKSVTGNVIVLRVGKCTQLNPFYPFCKDDESISIAGPHYDDFMNTGRKVKIGHHNTVRYTRSTLPYVYKYCFPGPNCVVPLSDKTRVSFIFRRINCDNRGRSRSTYYIKYNHNEHPDVKTLNCVRILMRLRKNKSSRFKILPVNIVNLIKAILLRDIMQRLSQEDDSLY